MQYQFRSFGIGTLVALALLAGSANVAAQTPLSRYAVKFICGKGDGRILAVGDYTTAINIMNPNHDPESPPIEFRKKYSLALPGENSGGTTDFIDGAKLNPGEAFEIDCPDILEKIREICPFQLCKGFATLEGSAELEIVAVYSAADPQTGGVRSIHTERVTPAGRCPVRRVEIDPQSILFIPPHVRGDREFDGHGPCITFSLDLRNQDQGTALVASAYMHAYECNGSFDSPQHDYTAAEGRRDTVLFTAPPGSRILGYSVASSMDESYIDNDHADDFFAYAGNNPVLSLRFTGDTSGDESGTKTGVLMGLRGFELMLEDCGLGKAP